MNQVHNVLSRFISARAGRPIAEGVVRLPPMAARLVGRWAVPLLAAVWIESTLWIQTLLDNLNYKNGRVREQMGGNSPSRFPPEQDEGGGVTFLKGIRVSQTQRFQPDCDH